jgi:hypothetical protein
LNVGKQFLEAFMAHPEVSLECRPASMMANNSPPIQVIIKKCRGTIVAQCVEEVLLHKEINHICNNDRKISIAKAPWSIVYLQLICALVLLQYLLYL